MANTVVTAKFTADTSDVSKKLAALQTQMTAMQAKFSSAGQAMMGVGASLSKGLTLPIVGVGAAAVVAGASFEKSMNKVKAVSGATGSQFSSMSDTAKELGRTTQFSASQAADGMSFLAMAGFKANEITGAMPGVLNLAAAGQMDLAQSADIASNILTGYGKTAGELDAAVDTLTKTFTSANVDLTMLGESFKYVAPIAKGAGLEFEEVSAAIGLLGNAGIQGSMAGTSLRMVIQKLLSPTGSAASVMERLGINATDTTGNLIPLNEIIGQLSESGATTADMMEIFGARAGPAMAALVSQGQDALINLTDEVSNAGGTAEAVAETQMEGFSGSMLRLKSAFEGAMIAIAESGVLDALTGALEFGADALSKFTAVWEKIPGPVKSVTMVVAGFAAALGPLLWIGGKTLTMLTSMMISWGRLNARVRGAVLGVRTQMRVFTMEIKTAMIKAKTQMGALGAAAGVMGKKVVLAFRTIGTAAKGLIASFGPIGIALTGLTIAFEVFMSQSADTEATVDELKSTIDETTGAFTDLTAAAIASKLSEGFDPELLDNLEKYGLGIDEMTAALLEGGDAVTEIGQRFNDQIDPTSRFFNTLYSPSLIVEMERRFGGVAKSVDATRDSMASTEYAAQQASAAMQQTSGVVQTSADDFDDLAESVSDTRTEMDKVNEMFSTFDANVAAIRARDEAKAYMDGLDEALGKVATNLFAEGKAAQRNRDVVIGAFEAKKKELTTWAEATGATAGEVEAKWRDMTQEVYQLLLDEGLDARDLAVFLGQDHIGVASVNVRNVMKAEVEETGSVVGAEAKKQGTYIGRQLSNGLIAGVDAGIPPMERAMSKAANAAAYAYKHHSQISSPSKVFREIGKDLMEGLRIGIEENTDWVDRLGESLTDRLSRAIESGDETIYQAARGAFVDWYKEIEGELKNTLDQAQAEFDAFADNVQNSLMRGVNLRGAFEGQFNEAGAASGVSLLEGFRSQVQGVQWAGDVFRTVKQQAMVGGASKEAAQALAMALAAEGPVIGGKIGQQILDEGLAPTLANEYGAVLEATRSVGEALMPEHLLIGRNNAQAEHDAWVERMGPGGDLRKFFLSEWRRIGVETSQQDYEGMRDAIKEGGPVGDAIMNLFKRLGKRSAARTADKFTADIAGSQGARMNRSMDTLAASLNRTATVTVTTVHRSVYESVGLPGRALGGPVAARQAYVVGERGPEVFVPDMAGNIIPNNKMGSIPTMGGGVSAGRGGGNVTNVNINVNAGMGTNGSQVGREIVDALKQYERHNGPVPISVR